MSTSLPPVLVGNHITASATHTVIDLEFSGTIERGSGSIIITDGALQTVIDRATGLPTLRVVGATQTYQVPLSQVGINGNHALVNADNLSAGHHYSVFIAPGVLASNGMPFAGVTNAAQLSFVAVDDQPPTLAGMSLDNHQLAAGAGATLTLRFSEPVNLDPSALTVPNATISGLVPSDGGLTWHASVAAQPGVEASSNQLQLDMSAVRDLAGNHGSGMQSVSYSVDAKAPVINSIAIGGATPVLNADSTVTITFSEPVHLSPAALTAPGANISDWHSTDGITYTASLTPQDGASATGNLLTVNMALVTDNAGNAGTGTISSPNTYSVDTIAPVAPGVPVLDSGTDSGLSADDAITNVNPPVIHGSGAEPFAWIELYDMAGDSQVLLGSVAASATGTWTIDLKSAYGSLSEGFHQLQAVQYDEAGNKSVASDPLQLTMDTHAMSPVIAPLVSGSDTGTVGDWITAIKQPTLGGTAEAGAKIDVFDGAQLIDSTVADVHGAWTFAFKADLGDGVHNLSIRQTDVAGNVSEPALQALTIDTTAPGALTGLMLDAGSDTGTSQTDGITKATKPLLTGAGAQANATIELYDGDKLVASTTSHQDGTWQVAPTADLLDGVHAFCVRQVDAAGNTGPTSAPISVTIDTLAPTVAGHTSSVALGTNFEIWFSEPVVHSGLTNYADVNDNVTATLFHFALGNPGSWDDNVSRDDHPSSVWHFMPSNSGWVELELTGIQDLAGNVATIPRAHYEFTVPLTSILPPPVL
jgi:hypothetical protein